MKPPYTCVRCGYETQYTTSMRKHLYCKLKTCPGLKNDIELTDSVKESIMINRIHKIKKKDDDQIVVVINNITSDIGT